MQGKVQYAEKSFSDKDKLNEIFVNKFIIRQKIVAFSGKIGIIDFVMQKIQFFRKARLPGRREEI